MFCPHCGQSNLPDSLFCTYCGTPLNYDNNSLQSPPPINPYSPPQMPYPPYPYSPYPPIAPIKSKQTSACAVTGFVFSLLSIFLIWIGFFLALLGVILSGVGVSQCNRLDQDGKGLGIAGVIISSFILFLYILLFILLILGASFSVL